MDDNYSICGICCKLLEKTEINKYRHFNVPSTDKVIKISDALFYLAPEANLTIFEQMELCSCCIKNLRSAYKFKYECILAQTKISKFLQENKLSLEEDAEKHENSDDTLLPKPPEEVSKNCPLENNENGDTVRETPDISIQNNKQPKILEKILPRAIDAPDQNKTDQEGNNNDTEAELPGKNLLQASTVSDDGVADKSVQICETGVVSNQDNVIPKQANLIHPPELTFCEITGLFRDPKGQYFSIRGEYGKSFETKAVQTEDNLIAKQTNVTLPPDLTFYKRTGLLKSKPAQDLSASESTIQVATVKSCNNVEESENIIRRKVAQSEENIIRKQGNVVQPPKSRLCKATGLFKYKQDRQLSTNKKNSKVFTITNVNNPDEIGNILQTKVAQSEENVIPKQVNAIGPSELKLCGGTSLLKDKERQYINTKKSIIHGSTVSKSNIEDGNREASQIEATHTEDIMLKQENVTEPPKLTFCETTGLFKDNNDQPLSADGQLIESSDLEKEVQKAVEKVNSIFTEPSINKPVITEIPPIVPLQSMGLTANAGILTPVTVSEDNGVLSITPVGDVVKNSFLTLENPFMMEDMIDIKEEPLEKYDFDMTATDEDTISAPETMLQDSGQFGGTGEFGGTDEYVDVPEFVMVNKNGENGEENLKKMQPAALKEKLFGNEHRLMHFGLDKKDEVALRPVKTVTSVGTMYNPNPGFIGLPLVNPVPYKKSPPIVSSIGKPRKRIYKRVKMVPAFLETVPSPEASVKIDASIYIIRKQHPSIYSNEYLASFFTKNGDYRYDHDYIVNMYHHSVAIVLDAVAGKKLWFCRLCNNQQWTLKHGEHMLEAHATATRCTVCNVDMDSPFALNLHVEQHTEPCQYCAESVTYGMRAAHALKHQAEEQLLNETTEKPLQNETAAEHTHANRSRKRRRSRQRDSDNVPNPTCSPDIPSPKASHDEVAGTAQTGRNLSEAELENLLYKTDESQDSLDDVSADTSYSPTPGQKRKLRSRKRKKSEVVAVEPSGRLLRSHKKS